MWNDQLQALISIYAFILAQEVIFDFMTHCLRLSQLKLEALHFP